MPNGNARDCGFSGVDDLSNLPVEVNGVAFAAKPGVLQWLGLQNYRLAKYRKGFSTYPIALLSTLSGQSIAILLWTSTL